MNVEYLKGIKRNEKDFNEVLFKAIWTSFKDYFSSEVKEATKEAFSDGGVFKDISKSSLKLLEKGSKEFKNEQLGKTVPSKTNMSLLLKLDKEPDFIYLNSIIQKICKKYFNEDEIQSIMKNELDDNDIINKLLNIDDIDDPERMAVCMVLGVDGTFIFEILSKRQEEFDKKFRENAQEIENKVQEAVKKEKEKQDKKVAQEIKKATDKLNKAQEKEFAAHKAQIEKIEAQHKKEIADLEKSFKAKEKANSAKEVTPTPAIKSNARISEEQAKQIANQPEKQIVVDAESVLDDIHHRLFLGYIDIKSIEQNENKEWVVSVQTMRDIIPDVSYINKEELKYRNYHFGNFAQKYTAILTGNKLAKITGRRDFDNFKLWESSEQLDEILSIFMKKTILFRVEVADYEDGSTYYNAQIEKVLDIEDFGDYYVVPIIDLSKKNFDDIIKKNGTLSLFDYPYTVANAIRYVHLNGNIRRVDLIPNLIENADEKQRCIWKVNSNENISIADQSLQDELGDYLYIPERAVFFVRKAFLQEKEQEIATNAKSPKGMEGKFIEKLCAIANSQHLCYKQEDLINFHISIKSSNLVILAGPSGLGKTKLPEIYADALDLSEANHTLLFVPVNPSFTEPNDLLGYVKPYIYNKDSESKNGVRYNGVYEESSSQIVSFLKKAHENQDKLHIVIFDEMNLAQIEYWFAPFMSILERDKADRNLQLYSSNLLIENADKYPSSIKIGENVVFIGTINLDETTKDISDRLFDRALVINLHKKTFLEYKNEESKPMSIELKNYKIPYANYLSFRKNSDDYVSYLTEQETKFLDRLHEIISSLLPQKGVSFRNIKMISHYLSNASTITDNRGAAFDLALKQSVIRKINGNETEMEEFLQESGEHSIFALLNEFKDVSEFKETRAELESKLKEIKIYGFAR